MKSIKWELLFHEKIVLQYHKFSHECEMLQIYTQKPNKKPQNWQCALGGYVVENQFKIFLT